MVQNQHKGEIKSKIQNLTKSHKQEKSTFLQRLIGKTKSAKNQTIAPATYYQGDLTGTAEKVRRLRLPGLLDT
jgi:hypothetical protein